jgi:hypothetical protein
VSKEQELRALFEEVLDCIHDDDGVYLRDSEEETRAAFRALLDALLTADGWHKWPEEQPGETGEYLVRCDLDGKRSYNVLARWGGLPGPAYWWAISDHDRDMVIFWRLLPDPPST